MGDESAFVKCKQEMLTPPTDDEVATADADGGDLEYSMDITVKVHQASMHAATPASRTAEQNAAVKRERLEARQARMKDLEKLFEDLHTAKTTGDKMSSTQSQSTNWRVHYPLHAAAEVGDGSEVQRLLDRPGAHGESCSRSRLCTLSRTNTHLHIPQSSVRKAAVLLC